MAPVGRKVAMGMQFSGQEISNMLWGLMQVLQTNEAVAATVGAGRWARTMVDGGARLHQRQRQQQLSEGGEQGEGQSPAGAIAADDEGEEEERRRYRDGLMPLVEAARRRAPGMDPPALAQVAWVGSQLGGSTPRSASSLVPRSFSSSSSSAADPSSSAGGLLAHAVCSAALPRLSEFNAQDLATMVHSLAAGGGSADWALFFAAGDAAVPLLRRGEFSASG